MTEEPNYPSCKHCGAKMEKSKVYCDNCNTFSGRFRAFIVFTHRPEFFVVLISTSLIVLQVTLLLMLRDDMARIKRVTNEIMVKSTTFLQDATEAITDAMPVRYEFINQIEGLEEEVKVQIKEKDMPLPIAIIDGKPVPLHETECKSDNMNNEASRELCQQVVNSFCNAHHPYNVDEFGNPKSTIIGSIGSGIVTSYGLSGIGIVCLNSKIKIPPVLTFEEPASEGVWTRFLALFD